MKHLARMAALLLLVTLFMACEKEQVKQTAAPEAVWVTPTGYVIPAAEKDNWKAYLAENLKPEKIDKKRYKSQSCVLANSNCNLECTETTDRDPDCVKESACAPCLNCGCTPTTPR